MPERVAHYDAIIIGGGHNGLVAAGYLARAGLRTLTLERRENPGGATSRVEYFPGYVASLANSPGSLEPKVVSDLELGKHGLVFDKPDAALVVPFSQEKGFIGWRDKVRSVDQLRQFSERDAERYYEFFGYFESFAEKLRINLFEPPVSIAEVAARAEAAGESERFARIFLGNIVDLLDEWFESDEVKALIAAQTTVNNFVSPSSPGTPFRLLQRPLSMFSSQVAAEHDPRRQPMRGATGLPRGGMGAVGESLASSLRAAGGELITDAEVARIDVVDGRTTGVTLSNGDSYTADVVLSNLSAHSTLLDLLDEGTLDDGFTSRLRAKRLTGSAFKMALALDGLPEFAFAAGADRADTRAIAAAQFRIAPSVRYMEQATADARQGRSSARPMMWGLTPSVTDPGLAPAGKQVMSVNVFHAPYELGAEHWATEKDRFGQLCIDTLAEYIPNLADIIVDQRFWSPVDLETEFGLRGGNVSVGDMMPDNMFDLRPLRGLSDYRTPVRGLYLCGSAVWPGGLVTGVPGHNASHIVLDDLRADA